MTLIDMAPYHSNLFILVKLYHRGEPLYFEDDDGCEQEAYTRVLVEKRQGIQIA